jgi:predicted RNase H-like nuclease (RuvC/YqgF family)
MSNLELHPEIRRLLSENSLFKEELAHLLTEYETMIHTVRPNLMALYQTKIGVWELKLLKQQANAARLKRKLELIQAQLNQGILPNIFDIDKQLDHEFLLWQAKIKEAADKITDAESRLKSFMSPADNREFKKLYYALVKKCHPDVVAMVTDETKLLWRRVQSAYENSDLEELRAIALLADKIKEIKNDGPSLSGLKSEKQSLKSQIERLTKQISELEKRAPFYMQVQLHDEKWINKRRREIEKQIKSLQKRIESCEKHLQSLIPGIKHAGRFSTN